MLYLIIIILLVDFILERSLDYLNSKTWSQPLPAEVKDLYDAEKYAKAMDYDKANSNFSLISSAFSLILMLAILLTGGFSSLNIWVQSITTHPIYSCLLFFAVLSIASDIITLPFSLYSIFVIEEKFGFNKMTIKTFIADKLKGYLIGGIIGGALLSAFVWFYGYAGENFWIYIWIIFSAFMLLMNMFYASWILPLFNKLTPLDEGELRTAIENYCSKVDFKLDNLFVMDGSKRSAKANAFFSGLGKKKRIVLYDTLINQHNTEELVAVLAHEIGHYKKKHTQQSFIVSIIQTGVTLFIFSRFVNNAAIAAAMGSAQPSLVLGMLGFGMLYSPVSMVIGLLMNILSRKNEYEADNYAATTYAAKPLADALKKLSVNQLSNLQPHPLYVFFNYSHPTLLQRLKAMHV